MVAFILNLPPLIMMGILGLAFVSVSYMGIRTRDPWVFSLLAPIGNFILVYAGSIFGFGGLDDLFMREWAIRLATFLLSAGIVTYSYMRGRSRK